MSKLKALFILILIVFCLFPLSAEGKAKTKPTIAVLNFENQGVLSLNAQIVQKLFTSKLVESRAYQVIEREKIDELLKEVELQHSDITNASTVAQIGEILNAEFIVIGSLMKLGSSYILEARMIKVETAQIYSSGSKKFESIEMAYDVMGDLVLQLIGESANKEEGTGGLGFTDPLADKTKEEPKKEERKSDPERKGPPQRDNVFFDDQSAHRDSYGNGEFLQFNLWFEDPRKIYFINYKVGKRLMIGTPVKIIEVNTNAGTQFIRFEAPFRGKKEIFTVYINPSWQPQVSAKDAAGILFTHDPPKELARKFSQEEIKHIRAGKVVPGMSKRAVFAAFGPPPRHRTKSLEMNKWFYWQNRFRTIQVIFKDGKVVKLIQ